MKNFIAHTDEIREQMLQEISCSSVDDLFSQIPVKFKEFNMSNPLSELETQRRIKALANKNQHPRLILTLYHENLMLQ